MYVFIHFDCVCTCTCHALLMLPLLYLYVKMKNTMCLSPINYVRLDFDFDSRELLVI